MISLYEDYLDYDNGEGESKEDSTAEEGEGEERLDHGDDCQCCKASIDWFICTQWTMCQVSVTDREL